MKVIHILSGGLDSTTLLYWLIKKKHTVETITFNYGQRHIKEIKSAVDTCKTLNIANTVVDISSITNLISNSSLTSNIEVPEGHYQDENMKTTVVPSRNTIMASIAQGYAVNKNFDAISLGVHSGDHAIYPDCRPEFIKYLRRTFLRNNYKPIKILVPFINKNKSQIIEIGKKLKVNYKLTWTCYKGEEKPCGKCGSCVERLEAFKENNLIDPLN